jgi:hypothetical protein
LFSLSIFFFSASDDLYLLCLFQRYDIPSMYLKGSSLPDTLPTREAAILQPTRTPVYLHHVFYRRVAFTDQRVNAPKNYAGDTFDHTLAKRKRSPRE